MAAPDFTQFVLETLHNDWGQGPEPAPPKPIIIDRRDTSRMGQREPNRKADLTVNNAIGVGAAPNTDNQPTGFGFNYTFEGGADVRVEGRPTTESGHITPRSGDWSALTGEAQRCINAKRRWPIPNESGDGGAYTAYITNISDESQQWQDHYRMNFDVLFRGREMLP